MPMPDELSAEEELTLVELVNRVLDRGVAITGGVVLSIAGVDLVYLGLNVVLTSVESARRTAADGGARILPPGVDER